MNKFIFHFSHHLLYLYMKRLFILLLIVLLCIPGFTQIRNDVPRYNPDSVREELDKRPYFSLYKDNYFIGGTTIGSKPTNKNSDVKFQLSISQRLTKSKLPFDTYLFITYTQKAFWNVFQESLPMYDLNFNPGIGLSHLVIYNPQIQISEKSQTKRIEIADSRKTKRPKIDKRTTHNKRHSNAIITL